MALRKALAEYENALGDWKLKTGTAFGAELRELEQREPDVWYDYLAEMRKAGKPASTDPPRRPTAESLRMCFLWLMLRGERNALRPSYLMSGRMISRDMSAIIRPDGRDAAAGTVPGADVAGLVAFLRQHFLSRQDNR